MHRNVILNYVGERQPQPYDRPSAPRAGANVCASALSRPLREVRHHGVAPPDEIDDDERVQDEKHQVSDGWIDGRGR